MKNKTTLLLIGFAALAAAVAFYAGSVMMENDQGSLASNTEQMGQATTNDSSKLADRSLENREAREKKEKDKSEKRRFKTRADRERLVAALEFAKRQRLMQRLARDKENRESRRSDTEDDEVNDKLSKEVIQDAVEEVIPEIEDCYDTVLKNDEYLGGKISVYFRIIGEPDVGGIIEDVEIVKEDSEGSLATNEDFTHCILDSMDLIELPAPEDGGEVKVTYPFMFTPPGED